MSSLNGQYSDLEGNQSMGARIGEVSASGAPAGRPRAAVWPGEGERLAMSTGVGVVYKIAGEETGGAFAVVEHPVAPGAFVPPHTHAREDELSYVLTGEIGVMVVDQELAAPAGTYVFKPRGVPHAFWNAGSAPARILELIWPP